MTTEPSTRMPKSIAPRERRLAAIPICPMPRAGKEHRHRDGGGDEQAGAQVAEEEEEDGDDQDRPGDEVVLDRVDDLVDQFGAVVDGFQDDVFGQGLAHDLQALFQRRGHFTAVLPHEHEAEAEDHFALPLAGDRPAAQFMADAHLGDIARPAPARRHGR